MVNTGSIHRNTDISAIIKSNVTNELNNASITVNDFDLTSEIIERYGVVSILTAANITITKNGRIYQFNYNTQDSEQVEDELVFLLKIFKDSESSALNNYSTKKVEREYSTPKIKSRDDIHIKKFESVSFKVDITCKIEEIINFLTQDKFVQYWAGSSYKRSGNLISFENIEMEIINIEAESITFNYKWADWAEFSIVKINFQQEAASVMLKIRGENIPVGFGSNFKTHWMERIIYRIGTLFNLRIRN